MGKQLCQVVFWDTEVLAYAGTQGLDLYTLANQKLKSVCSLFSGKVLFLKTLRGKSDLLFSINHHFEWSLWEHRQKLLCGTFEGCSGQTIYGVDWYEGNCLNLLICWNAEKFTLLSFFYVKEALKHSVKHFKVVNDKDWPVRNAFLKGVTKILGTADFNVILN